MGMSMESPDRHDREARQDQAPRSEIYMTDGRL